MRFPWHKPAATPQEIPRQRLGPSLLSVVVVPVTFNGDALKHRLVMRFDTGEIILGEATDADKLRNLASEIKKELGMK